MLTSLAIALYAQLAAGDSAQLLRYDLRPGDHLIYQQIVERELDGRAPYGIERPGGRPFVEPVVTRSRHEWTTHLLVAGEAEGAVVLGVQRNRERGELLSHAVAGADRLAEERPRFDARWREAGAFADGNRHTAAGAHLLGWTVARELPGKLLWALHELEPLPSHAVAPGDRWESEHPMGFAMRAVGWEEVDGERCLRLDGASTADLLMPRLAHLDSFRLRLWFCPGTGLARRVELEGAWPTANFERMTEYLTLRLTGRRRGERIEAWLADPALAAGARAALAVSDSAERDTATAPSAASSSGAPSGALCADLPGWADSARAARRTAWQPRGTRLRGMRDPTLRGWPYVARVPPGYRPGHRVPLLIYLAGNLGSALEGVQLVGTALDTTGYLVVYPNAGDLWVRNGPTEMMPRLLDEVAATYDVDDARIYLTGLSNGGTGVLRYASLWPHRFTAAVSAMGGGMFGAVDVGGDRTFPDNVAALPLLFLHGERDAAIAPEATTKTVAAMGRRAAPVEVHMYPGRGHDIVLGRDEGRTLAFLERFAGRRPPRELRFSLTTLRGRRHWWVEVLEKEDGERSVAIAGDDALAGALRQRMGASVVAEVRARIEDDNTIRVDTRRVRRLKLLLRPDLLARPGRVRVVLNGRRAFDGELPVDCDLVARSWAASHDLSLVYSAELVLDAAPSR